MFSGTHFQTSKLSLFADFVKNTIFTKFDFLVQISIKYKKAPVLWLLEIILGSDKCYILCTNCTKLPFLAIFGSFGPFGGPFSMCNLSVVDGLVTRQQNHDFKSFKNWKIVHEKVTFLETPHFRSLADILPYLFARVTFWPGWEFYDFVNYPLQNTLIARVTFYGIAKWQNATRFLFPARQIFQNSLKFVKT